MYPALAVLQRLTSSGEFMRQGRNVTDTQPSLQDVLWVGGEGGMEIELVKREKVPLTMIPAAGVHGVALSALPGNLWRICRGIQAARLTLKKFNPDVILFTGGYIGIPVVLAARMMGLGQKRPAMLAYVPDIEPGLALKLVCRLVDHIAVTVQDSIGFIPANKKSTVTGYPTRENLLGWDKEEAYQLLNLTPRLPTLLILGGSRGARSINSAILAILPDLLEEMQVIHVTGTLDWPEISHQKNEHLSLEHADRLSVYPYLHEEIGAALTVADLVVSRAGASTLGELPLFGLPAILIPYPYAWRYQITNAQYLANCGAAEVLADDDLKEKLLPMVQDIIRDHERLNAMKKAMRSLAHPKAADKIGKLVYYLGSSKSQLKD
ncbi:MAG: UDP-N-acetylglucosamine--N-acetylmuramyl-(pentapeptide) pyrophosphoryl-undecaprenol N-acetylglucosamine transferase [Anaerolineales bacterium]|nr:UDP-N-acetylglucosamine--N-acetylmuramyl-(pentapeptide) pyrophosphoryl-undecaprenol N-acetylglucosamine transferase [Anaerolineales bacterium]